MMKLCLLAAAALAAACSTAPVQGVCCTGPDDCARLGLSEDRPCPTGLACANNRCELASCSVQGCTAEAPVCDPGADVCAGCRDSADCSRFADRDVCAASGACVECLAAADCASAAEPVCDAGTCRACRRDSECASGACGDDGACVPESQIVYVAPGGINNVLCTRTAPCAGLQFAIRQTGPARQHIVLVNADYVADEVSIDIGPLTTLAPSVSIHGGGSEITAIGSENMLSTNVPTKIFDLRIAASAGGIYVRATTHLERVSIKARNSIAVNGTAILRDVSIESTAGGVGISMPLGALDLDRATISGGNTAISADFNTTLQISNLLTFNTVGTSLDVYDARGTIAFSTIAHSGNSSSQVTGIRCSNNEILVRASIIWTPGASVPPVSGCALVSVIAGPFPVAGSLNADPRFASPYTGDFRLAPNSPARDAADTGPALDFEGDQRPRGARFDLGADETL